MPRSLIIACSATKLADPGFIPAFQRYDGPAWRTLRANIPAAVPFSTYALSAEHGLIPAHWPIADYDRQMTVDRARELAELVAYQLEREPLAEEVFAFGGGVYRDCLEQARAIGDRKFGRGIAIDYSSGGIGDQLGQLKTWIRREA